MPDVRDSFQMGMIVTVVAYRTLEIDVIDWISAGQGAPPQLAKQAMSNLPPFMRRCRARDNALRAPDLWRVALRLGGAYLLNLPLISLNGDRK